MLFAVIGGSEAYRLLESDFSGENLGGRDTPFGKSVPARKVEGPSGDFLFMSRHGEKDYTSCASYVNYRANLFALKDLGVTHVLAWSGPGAINPDLTIGSFVVATDLIDQTHRRESTFIGEKGLGFVRQNPVFCPTLRKALTSALQSEGVAFTSGGTYVVTEGPRLETPAEIRMFKAWGADLVGMTLAPEVFLARELELHYAALCYVTNVAEGLADREFKPGVLFEGLASRDEAARVAEAVGRFGSITKRVQALLAEAEPECHCENLLDRYRKKGMIGTDFREYVS